MTDIHFIEEKRTYRGHGHVFTEPGVYPVSDDTDRYLLADFPQWFEAIEDTKQNLASPTPKQPDATEGVQNVDDGKEPTKPLSKMNKDELEAYASEIGLEVTDEMDTNKKLKEAIEKQESKK